VTLQAFAPGKLRSRHFALEVVGRRLPAADTPDSSNCTPVDSNVINKLG